MMNAWVSNCRDIPVFMRKEIKDKKRGTKRDTRRKMLGEQLSGF